MKCAGIVLTFDTMARPLPLHPLLAVDHLHARRQEHVHVCREMLLEAAFKSHRLPLAVS